MAINLKRTKTAGLKSGQQWLFICLSTGIVAGMLNFFGGNVAEANELSKAPRESQVAANQPSTESDASEISMPMAQKKFIEAIESTREEYLEASNELKKSAARTKRAKLIQPTLGKNRNISGWVVEVTEMGTNREGNATLGVRIPNTGILIQTRNFAFGDDSNTLIKHGSALYNAVSDLNVGDLIKIDGVFIRSDKSDYIYNVRLTERGAMVDPLFLFRFTAAKKY